ncbi:MAG: GntR family transcriptional regulator [Pirellulaceae bacterium]|jgi:DNA-binding FadR family transcriptional regulator|nr:GntR family transcriptional regulator [Pirellulaceae bacterium]
MLEAVRRPKIRDLVAEQLTAYIAAQGLRPGDRLPTEQELATRFGVSRLSLREATKALEFLGIVEAKPGRGLSVGRADLARMTGYLGFHPALQDAAPQELIGTRVVIETGVLPYVLATLQRDPAVADSLVDINDRMRRARTLSDRIDLDIAFHRRLVEASGLAPLLTFSDLLATFFRQFRESVRKADWKAGVQSHQRVIDALRAGKLGIAREELQRHIESHAQRISASRVTR